MSDEKNEQKQADGGEKAGPAPTLEDDSKNKLRAQLSEYGKTIKELQAQLNTYTDAEKKKAEEDAMKRGEYEKLIAERDAKLQAMADTVAAKERALIAAEVKAQLVGLNKLEMAGAIASMPADLAADKVGEWVETFKADNKDLFTKAPVGVGGGAAGEPHRGTATQTVAQLRAELRDPAKAKAAAAELERRVLSGQTI